MQRDIRIKRELAKISQNPPKGISVSCKEDQLNILEAQIIGPNDTPYENGIFNLEIQIPERYPFCPPTIKFITKVYHPNIDETGRICLDLLKMPPKGGWKPTMGIEGLLVAIGMLLENPNPNDPLIGEIGEEYTNNRKEFVKKAKEYATKYANA